MLLQRVLAIHTDAGDSRCRNQLGGGAIFLLA
jgi:hypothetical protein